MFSSQTTLIGVLRSRDKPGDMATAMAMAAMARGCDLIYFSMKDVDPEAGLIRAKRFDGMSWKAVVSRFPDVIDNDDLSLAPRHAQIFAALTRGAPHSTHRLGGKLQLTQRMRRFQAFRRLEIPQIVPRSTADLLDFLARHSEVVLKPAIGSQGRDIWKLSQSAAGAEILVTGPERSFTTTAADSGLLAQITGGRVFMAQRYIESRLDSGSAFDVRLHIRRDESGDWRLVRTYPRIGLPGKLTSNIATGGSAGDIKALLAYRYGAQAAGIQSRLRRLARDLPLLVQRAYPEFMIDALGIDLGLDAEGQPWLFEINSFPGAKSFELRAAMLRIGYCLWLLRNLSRAADLTADLDGAQTSPAGVRSA